MTVANATLDFVAHVQRGHFTIVDYIIFILLIVISISIGIYVGFKQWSTATTKEFLQGGRTMHPIPVAMSLIGGVISALSVLGNATETYLHGTQLWLNIFGCLGGVLVVMFIILPILYPLDQISLMQYLILRYKSPTLKKCGSFIQIFALFLYLGVCLYAPSLALTSVTTLSSSASIVILGLVCVIYITLGGVKAVIYTDVLQTTLMFFGIFAVLVVSCIDVGGVAEVFKIAEKGGRMEFFNMDLNPLVRHTFWSVQVLGLYFTISTIGISQSQYQRLTSVRTLKSAQGLCVIFFVGMAILWSMFYFTGIVAYATYVDCDPLKSGLIQKPDQIVPFLVADKLSHLPGMSGLFVSAVYGAVLSSVSSAASAISALLWEDFLSESKWFPKNIKVSPINVTRSLCMNRLLPEVGSHFPSYFPALSGLIGIGLAFLISQLGTLFQAAYSISGAAVSPLDGLILTGIIAPWVTEKGAICGFISAFIFNMWLIIGKFVYGGGKTTPLPVSTEGCPSNLTNGSLFTISPLEAFEEGLTTVQPELFFNDTPERDYLAMYDISYCYYGAIGMIIVFTVSTIVSILTGPSNPYEIEERLVNKNCLQFYRKLWNRFSSKGGTSISTNLDSCDSKPNMIDNVIANKEIEMTQR